MHTSNTNQNTNPTECDNGDEDQRRPRHIEVPVNGVDVRMLKGETTGLAVKQAAIEQGVNIEIGFLLTLVKPNGRSEEIGDEDQVRIRPNIEFFAVPDDDNS